MALLTRQQLSKRWGISPRTVDRWRSLGELPWIDLCQGRGRRPIVRFRVEDIGKIEGKNRMALGEGEGRISNVDHRP